MQTFKHRYTNETDFDVIEVTDKETRGVDKDYPDYLKALADGVIFEKISGGEFVEILVGEVTIRADKEAVLLERQWAVIRAQRDNLLTKCDYTQMTDNALCGDAEWVAYRQALKDIPQTQTDPYAIVWPAMPGTEATE